MSEVHNQQNQASDQPSTLEEVKCLAKLGEMRAAALKVADHQTA